VRGATDVLDADAQQAQHGDAESLLDAPTLAAGLEAMRVRQAARAAEAAEGSKSESAAPVTSPPTTARNLSLEERGDRVAAFKRGVASRLAQS